MGHSALTGGSRPGEPRCSPNSRRVSMTDYSMLFSALWPRHHHFAMKGIPKIHKIANIVVYKFAYVYWHNFAFL